MAVLICDGIGLVVRRVLLGKLDAFLMLPVAKS
jgi:hypothetical protein